MIRRMAASIYSVVLVAALWEVIARAGLVPFFFLPPLSVVAASFRPSA